MTNQKRRSHIRDHMVVSNLKDLLKTFTFTKVKSSRTTPERQIREKVELSQAKKKLEEHVRKTEVFQKQMDKDKVKCQKFAAQKPKEQITPEEHQKNLTEYRSLMSAGKIGLEMNEETYQNKKKAEKEVHKLRECVGEFKEKHASMEKVIEERRDDLSTVYNDTHKQIRAEFGKSMADVKLEPYFRLISQDQVAIVKANGKEPHSLSGGEKSKTMVCLIGALWKLQNTPFVCLDEWDVGLDDDARPEVERTIITIGTEINRQLFLINPTKASANSFSQKTEDMVKRLYIEKQQ